MIEPKENRTYQTRPHETAPGVVRAYNNAFFERLLQLESCRTKWQYGEWQDLANIPLEGIETHPDRAKITLLIGAAKVQLGEIPAGRALLRKSRDWGCGRGLIARVLASAVHNSLGRVAVCLNYDDGATRHFEAALTLVERRADAVLLARTRRIRETARMGFLPDAVNLIGEDLSKAEAAPIDHAARVEAMREEFCLLSQEITQKPPPGASDKSDDAHHPIFGAFWRVSSESTGIHVYDFLGGATRASYNKDWARFATAPHKTARPNLPPKNEHYLDWIAVLTAAAKARGVFRMAEFGAGWAPWLVRGALAARQRAEVGSCELMAVEAEPGHYRWAREHFEDNGLNPDDHHVLHGAVSLRTDVLRFPVLAEPDSDYSTSLLDTCSVAETISVQGYTVDELLKRFSGPLDLVHVDIQGSEFDVLPPAIDKLSKSVRAIAIGTHRGAEAQEDLAALFRDNSWQEQLNLGPSKTTRMPWGEIRTDDGFLWFENARVL